MKKELARIISEAIGISEVPLEVPAVVSFGHYSTSLAMRRAKEEKRSPLAVAQELAEKISSAAPQGFFEKIEVAPPGFINFILSPETLRAECKAVVENDNFGIVPMMDGKRVMVEFTDVNPFKQVHVGHVMSNAIGESIARLYEAVGANIIRVNYQADVGLHVAMAIWAIQNKVVGDMPSEEATLVEKMAYLGRAYAAGSRAHRGEDPEHPDGKERIEEINRSVYERNDAAISELYDTGRRWSLDYFETLYVRLGTKFEHYFFESEVGKTGLEIIAANPHVFEKSEGAIVFHGEKYGLHTRVFVNSKGLPVYEGKELGLNKIKFDLYNPDLSVIVTGNEINDYFKVLLKAMELTIPRVAERTRHIGHGMLRLPTGKMSSRTGDVVTAESFIEDVEQRLEAARAAREDFSREEAAAVREQLAVGAIKYSILKQNPGQDIVFDFEKSLALHGDSGLYLQYTHARLVSLLKNAKMASENLKFDAGSLSELVAPHEHELIRKIVQFPDMVAEAAANLLPSMLAKYLLEFCNSANRFYEHAPILKDENEARRLARLLLAAASAALIKKGLGLLGIAAPERM